MNKKKILVVGGTGYLGRHLINSFDESHFDITFTGTRHNNDNRCNIVLFEDEKTYLNLSQNYYDFVILDTPPITRVSDALSLSRIVKDTVLVIRPGQTFKESISWAINELKTTGINFLGVLVNDCKIKSGTHKYEYGYSVKK